MPAIKLSTKYQVTLPMEMVRALGLKAGDRLVAELIDDHIVLLPQPGDWVGHFAGRMRGVWGDSIEEIDRHLAEERASYERDEWLEEFEDIRASDNDARLISDTLLRSPNLARPELDLLRIPGLGSAKVYAALEKLLSHGGVRKVPAPPGVGAYPHMYRLVRDCAERLRSQAVT